MRCPALNELSLPLNGKTGWPWTEETPQLPNIMTDGSPWPRISIVTPSYNQGQFIEETIRSILLQGYPDLEYIIIDGGSTDNSVEIIKKYESWLTYWISEPDRGQSHAINKGFKHASGEVMAWLNSDDTYTQGTLLTVGNAVSSYRGNNAKWTGWLVGCCLYRNTDSEETKNLCLDPPPDDQIKLLSWRCPQRSSFWSRACWDDVGPLTEDLHFIFDTEFFLKLAFSGHRPKGLDKVLAVGLLHKNCKTVTNADSWGMESLIMYDRLAPFLDPSNRRQLRRAVRADLARVRYNQARTNGRWLTAVLSAAKVLRYSPPWNRSEGLPI